MTRCIREWFPAFFLPRFVPAASIAEVVVTLKQRLLGIWFGPKGSQGHGQMDWDAEDEDLEISGLMVINPLEIEYNLIDVSKAVRGNHVVHIAWIRNIRW